jgi:hypothetical protein
VLTPAVADNLEELGMRVLAFEVSYRCHRRRVRWKFTRELFDRRMQERSSASSNSPHDLSRISALTT